MVINILNTKLQLVKNHKKEFHYIPPNSFINYSPLMKNGTNIYPKIDFIKKDQMCYIKINDKWLYKTDDGYTFKKLLSKQPLVCWIEYLNHPMFIIYIPTKYGSLRTHYLQYSASGVSVTSVMLEATIFNYNPINRSHYMIA